jgi:hypothetical protein
MENLNLQQPHAVNGTPPQVIDLPTASVTPLPVAPVALQPVVLVPVDAISPQFITAPRKESSAKYFKLGASIILDGIDLSLGWIPGLGQMIDLACVVLCACMWGKRGFFVLFEMIDFTGVVGAFMPTCTIIALTCMNDE